MADEIKSPDTRSASPDVTATPPPPPPPNGGLQAWLQVLGGHFLFFNSWGLVNSFGVFQTFYENSLLESSNVSDISWIGTFQAFLLLLLGVIIGPLLDRGYVRTIVVVGTFLSVFGIMMTSLATEYYQVFLAQGLCVGLGSGFLFLPSVAIVATYFTTKRAVATGIVTAGGSIGSVIYPIVFERLQPRIGFPWATRVLGFITLTTLAISIATLRSRLPPPKKSRALLDMAAFKSVPFNMFCAGLFLSFVGLYIPIFYIISWAEVHAHVRSDLAFYLLSVLNGASVFGRIGPGLLADRFGALELLTACTLLAGVLGYIATAVHNLGGLIIFALLYGFSSGAVVSLPASVIAGLAPNMAVVGTWMGMAYCFSAFGVLIGNPIVGTIIHVVENKFAGGFIFSGSLVTAAAGTYLLTYYAKFTLKRKPATS